MLGVVQVLLRSFYVLTQEIGFHSLAVAAVLVLKWHDKANHRVWRSVLVEEVFLISVLTVKISLKDKIEAFLLENTSIKWRYVTSLSIVAGKGHCVCRWYCLLPHCVINQVASWHWGGVTRSSRQRAPASAGREKLYSA